MNGLEGRPDVAVVDANDLFAEVLAVALRLRGLVVHLPAESGWSDVPAGSVIVLDPATATAVDGESVRRHVTAVKDAHVLLLTEGPARGQSTLARELAVVGWVSRDGTVDDLVHSISRAGMPGQTPPRARRPGRGDAALRRLTSRELQILERVAAGGADDDVARELDISVHTVRAHLQNIRLKLGVVNRFAAVAAARSAGLLSSDPLDARPHTDPR